MKTFCFSWWQGPWIPTWVLKFSGPSPWRSRLGSISGSDRAGKQPWLSSQAWVPGAVFTTVSHVTTPKNLNTKLYLYQSDGGDQWKHFKKSQGRWGRSTLFSPHHFCFLPWSLCSHFRVSQWRDRRTCRRSSANSCCSVSSSWRCPLSGQVTLPLLSPHPDPPLRGPVGQEHV